MEYKSIEPKCACCGVEGFPHVSKSSGKHYTYKQWDGECGVRQYEDTLAEWDERKKQLENGYFRTDNAKLMQSKSVDARYKVREQAIIEAVEESQGLANLDIDDADGIMTKVITREVVLSAEAPASARVAGYKTVTQAANRWPERSRDVPQNVTINVLDGEAARKLRDRVGLCVVDAEFAEDIEHE